MGGMEMPSASAVLRLITRSNLDRIAMQGKLAVSTPMRPQSNRQAEICDSGRVRLGLIAQRLEHSRLAADQRRGGMIRNYLSLFFDTRFTVSESAVNPPKVVQTFDIDHRPVSRADGPYCTVLGGRLSIVTSRPSGPLLSKASAMAGMCQ